jgi:5,10-methylenetetrahydrofolate reductase
MRLTDLSRSGHFIRIVEVFPPAIPSPEGLSTQKFDLGARFNRLVQGLIRTEPFTDAFSLPELKDGNRIHLNSVGIATELKKRTGSAIIPTITLRDANKHALFGLITYAFFSGLENILFVRGDPYENTSSSNNPKNVYDIGKLSNLVSLARKMESQIVSENSLCILSPINLAKSNDEKYLKTVRERELSGVDIFVGEQMFENLETYLSRIETIRKYGISAPIVHSIFPLKDDEDAISLVRKFGWGISGSELARLKEGRSRYGIEMARDRYHSLLRHKDLIQGVSVSTRGNPEVARYIFR